MRNLRRAGAAARRGFTLLEIIVVVTIIALLATLVAPRVIDNIWRSEKKVAKHRAASIAQQLSLYLADNGMSRPTDDLELSALTEGTSPYLEADDLLDPWGHPFLLVYPGQVHSGSFDIVSNGSDGEPGGEGANEDIVNP